MKQEVIVGTNSLLESGKRLWMQGLITNEQYNEMQQRNKILTDEIRFNTIVLN